MPSATLAELLERLAAARRLFAQHDAACQHEGDCTKCTQLVDDSRAADDAVGAWAAALTDDQVKTYADEVGRLGIEVGHERDEIRAAAAALADLLFPPLAGNVVLIPSKARWEIPPRVPLMWVRGDGLGAPIGRAEVRQVRDNLEVTLHVQPCPVPPAGVRDWLDREGIVVDLGFLALQTRHLEGGDREVRKARLLEVSLVAPEKAERPAAAAAPDPHRRR